ncbi:hypothetical protein [Desulfolucanica intricata]|uniref:hypothetical protein n=1 Tax=Desulfolucanica intricata TaxID=1285191 RepID=UPI00082E5AE1|nr:hypothetical protein [Desulfolucanica intricata]
MFDSLGLIMELIKNKDNPNKLADIYYKHTNELKKLEKKYPNWQSYLKPEVVNELKKKGLPI